MEDLKDLVLQQVYDNFVNSRCFKGSTMCDIGCDCSKEELFQAIIDLINEGKIEIISGNNPYIKSFDAVPVEEQIELLTTLPWHEFCIYPTQNVLENKRDVSIYDDRPFSKMLALGNPQFKCRFFNIDILFHYAEDPRYDYHFSDYLGSIYAYSTVEDSENIYLSTFSIGRNVEDYVVAVFLRDLNFMPAVAQQKWYSKMISDTSNCKVLKNFLDNQLLGSWCFPRTVFRAIIEEIENLYVLTNYIWGRSIFKNYYQRDDDRLRDFEMLLLPTNRKLDDFYQQLEVLTVDNLNRKFFELEDFNLKLSSYDKEGDSFIKNSKGTLLLLKEWLSKVKPECVHEIHGVLNEVRVTRSKGGAHNLLKSQYSKDYYKAQFDMADKVFNALNVLRRIIQTHPIAERVTIPHDSNYYAEI